LDERGADGSAEAAQLSRSLYRAAVRHGLAGPAAAYHQLYAGFAAAESRIGRVEHAGGMMAERKAAAEAQRARRAARASLAPVAARGRVPGHALAPVWGALAGLAALAAVFVITGFYTVEPDQAVIVDPPGSRLARVAAAMGIGAAEAAGERTEVVRTTGPQLGLPRPFADRHAVALGEQRAVIQARYRQTGPETYDVVFVQIQFRIADLDRWAGHDNDGGGVGRLTASLSSVLEAILAQQRSEARQAVRQSQPTLSDDQVGARADQLVEQRLEETVRNFVRAIGEAQAARDAGVQISRDSQFRLLRDVPGEVANAMSTG
jgi:hypothetical protein